ncbi:unnamed protein product [Coregonus sp. 'balchen']|nr:unnamed protein product [Coregonus sp. 'balchen']
MLWRRTGPPCCGDGQDLHVVETDRTSMLWRRTGPPCCGDGQDLHVVETDRTSMLWRRTGPPCCGDGQDLHVVETDRTSIVWRRTGPPGCGDGQDLHVVETDRTSMLWRKTGPPWFGERQGLHGLEKDRASMVWRRTGPPWCEDGQDLHVVETDRTSMLWRRTSMLWRRTGPPCCGDGQDLHVVETDLHGLETDRTSMVWRRTGPPCCGDEQDLHVVETDRTSMLWRRTGPPCCGDGQDLHVVETDRTSMLWRRTGPPCCGDGQDLHGLEKDRASMVWRRTGPPCCGDGQNLHVVETDRTSMVWRRTGPPCCGDGQDLHVVETDRTSMLWRRTSMLWRRTGPPCCGDGQDLHVVETDRTSMLWRRTSMVWRRTGPPWFGDGQDLHVVETNRTSMLWRRTGPPCCGDGQDLHVVETDRTSMLWRRTGPPCCGDGPPWFGNGQDLHNDETDSLSDVKWIQILAPPAHLLSLNPALSLTPDLDPLPVKTLPPPDPSSSDPQGPDAKRHPTAEPPPWGEERPDCRADVQSPPLPQPNIGKLLGGEEGSSPPMSASSSPPPYHHHHHHHSALENGCSSTSPSSPASPALSGLSEEPCKGNQTRVTVTPSDHHQPPTPSDPCPDAPVGERGGERSGGSSHVSHTHFTFEERLGGDETIAEKLNSKPETERAGAGSPIQDSGREEAGMAGGQSQDNGEEGHGNTGGTMEGPREQKECRNSSQKQKRLKGEKEKESRGGQDGEKTLTNGLATAGEEEEEEEGQSLLPPPSKEDSVTEEKEMEESKQENGGEGGSSVGSKLSNSHLQPLSGMFGGARPKQPVNVKLQIPWPLSGHVQNQLAPTANTTTAVCKNKNLENRAGGVTTDTATVVAGGDPGGCVVVVNGELLSGSPSSLLGLVVASESSPDNDLQAGYHHQGALPRKLLSSLGDVAPVWVPDSQAPVCMKCEARFTFTKRRHHCRASHSREGTCGGSNQSPNPNNPAEFCSTVPPLQQVQASGALASLPPPVMVPRKRVWFADGILANGEAAESPKPSASSPAPSQPLAVSQCSNKSFSTDLREASSPAPATTVGSPVGSSVSLIPEDGLPPILTSTGVKGDCAVEERPSEMILMQQLEDGGPDPLEDGGPDPLEDGGPDPLEDGDVNRKCWYVTSKGMHAVGQAEVVVLLQCLPDEKSIPKDIFSHFVQLYQEALKGNVLTHLGHSFFTQSFLGSREHGGFLYVSPSFQALQDLMPPQPPLPRSWETPLGMGSPQAHAALAPSTVVRFRKPLFGETGHTIMTLLVGLVVDMEARKTCVKIPGNRYNELMKAMNKSNEHVLAMGACFNEQADSHLVVTGACFFVSSGSLKAASGHLAKTSIVEDGVMVQITAETMDALRQALRDMKDFSITCGRADQQDTQEHVHIQWTDDDHSFFNKGVISPIDGKSMEFNTSVKIFHGSEFKANGKVIRWTESDDQPNGLSDPADHSRLTENVARAFCVALCPHLKLLKDDGMAKLGLRVTLESDQVGYLAGSNGQPLPSHYLSDLDRTLIPVIHRGAGQLSEGPVVMELVFYILEILS